jgi:hypothetical protein
MAWEQISLNFAHGNLKNFNDQLRTRFSTFSLIRIVKMSFLVRENCCRPEWFWQPLVLVKKIVDCFMFNSVLLSSGETACFNIWDSTYFKLVLRVVYTKHNVCGV